MSTHCFDAQYASIAFRDVWAIVRTAPDRPNVVFDTTWLVKSVVFRPAALTTLECQEKSRMSMASTFERGQNALTGDRDAIWMIKIRLVTDDSTT